MSFLLVLSVECAELDLPTPGNTINHTGFKERPENKCNNGKAVIPVLNWCAFRCVLCRESYFVRKRVVSRFRVRVVVCVRFLWFACVSLTRVAKEHISVSMYVCVAFWGFCASLRV